MGGLNVNANEREERNEGDPDRKRCENIERAIRHVLELQRRGRQLGRPWLLRSYGVHAVG